MYVIQGFFIQFICGVALTGDSLISGVLHIIRVQFEILTEEFTNLFDDKRNCNEILLHLKKCVKHHVRLLDTIKLVENSFNMVMLLQCGATITITCTTGFQLAHENNFNLHFMNLFYILVLACLELFYYCHYGNQLYESVSSILFFDFHQKNKKNKMKIVIENFPINIHK